MAVTAASAARATDHPRDPGCVTAGNVTRSLLGYLALAGPFYVVISLAQAVTRDGFSLAHDEWSLLAVWHLGWIQTVNLMLTGATILAGAARVSAAPPGGPPPRWAGAAAAGRRWNRADRGKHLPR